MQRNNDLCDVIHDEQVHESPMGKTKDSVRKLLMQIEVFKQKRLSERSPSPTPLLGPILGERGKLHNLEEKHKRVNISSPQPDDISLHSLRSKVIVPHVQ